MSQFETTTTTTLRGVIAAAIESIVPRHSPRQAERFMWKRGQEIAGGSTLRTFDVKLKDAAEVTDGDDVWYGGGVSYRATATLTVSYPVSEDDIDDFTAADHQDLSGRLVRLHTGTDGLFPIGVNAPARGPVLEPAEIAGEPGRYVVTYRTAVVFFVSDTVTTS